MCAGLAIILDWVCLNQVTDVRQVAARAIFGDGLENSLDGKVLWILQRKGEQSRTAITKELGNRNGGTELLQALARLRDSGQADYVSKPAQDGRLIDFWHAITNSDN